MALVDQMKADGMICRSVRVPTREVVYVKSIVEAYPGLATILAPPGRELGETARLFVVFHPGAEGEVGGMLGELSLETGLVVEEPW